MKKIIISILSTTLLLAGCSAHDEESSKKQDNKGVDTSKVKIKNYNQASSKLKIDNTKWKYDSKNKVYYQLNVSYVSKPQAKNVEKMGIYVPAAYFNGKKNSNGNYTVSINKTKKYKHYTAKTAPIVYPVNTPGYASQSAPKSYNYSSISKYMKSGFIYVQAGLRGRSMSMGNQQSEQKKSSYEIGAPWGVTDLKAAVRYYRFNSGNLPGNSTKVYTFGHSGGGAQSSIMGASGDSKLYYKYLKKIGAAMTDKDGKYISDKIDGAMAWCPITSLDQSDAAYEWNMGQFSNSGKRKNNTFTGQLSNDLAASYGKYLNKLNLKDGNKKLALKQSKNGEYTSGSYTKYLKEEIEKSATEFLNNTKFSYKKQDSQQAGMTMPSGNSDHNQQPPQMMGQNNNTKTYKTMNDYLKALNTKGKWITYNKKTKKAHITSLEDFAKYYKKPTKDVPAFDDLNKSQAENEVFGTSGSNSKLHFDKAVTQLLKDKKSEYSKLSGWKSKYGKAYEDDLTKKDALGSSISIRQNMYNPMYYLSDAYSGYGKSNVANNWRIRTGIQQGDTSLNVETNLALALKQIVGKGNVDFKTVWDKQHTMAETSGDPETNFINWVKKVNKK
ncbi:esterase [Staphylococcus sp. ACRSN]|uniref:subtype A tannase n=1 Tax=Staphylococcus sp. ACRSN TaxID=2918214 RepID=UPI001EF24BBF|nr:subtype A tannase [Staphylococcus sp. ACRSN]MCG7337757.1 esterase [Staphylococcus sp. ACRSN]